MSNLEVAKKVIEKVNDNYFGIFVHIVSIENKRIEFAYEVPILNIYDRFNFYIPEALIKDNTLIKDLYNYLLGAINKSIMDYFKIENE